MNNLSHRNLSRREREIMDILYVKGRASASDIREAMPEAPSYSAVRATLRVLEEKGQIQHKEENLRYLYLPSASREKAARGALKHLMETFFDRSAEQVVSALLDGPARKLSGKDLDRLAKLIEEAREERRK